MRGWRPWLAEVLVVLLLVQWGGAASACLQSMRWQPDQVLCHGPEQPKPDHGKAQMAGCPACAPLPPGLLPSVPEFPAPSLAVVLLPARAASVREASVAALVRPQQPRAPPVLI